MTTTRYSSVIELADVTVGVVARLILVVCTISVTRN